MQAVKVGVGVKGIGVIVFVGIGVGMVALSVDVIRVGVKTVTVPFMRGAGDDWIAVDEGLIGIEARGTCPQACKKATRIQRTLILLHTLAVYHNTLEGSS